MVLLISINPIATPKKIVIHNISISQINIIFAQKTKRMDPNNNQTLWQVVKKYFNVMPGKASEDNVIAQITEGVNFQGAPLWILILAIFVASLGLNVNSTAVIIGAMLISPLMGPIIGWNSRPEFVQESYHQLPHYHLSQRCYSYHLLFPFAYHRSTIRTSCTYIAHTLRCVDSTLWRCSRYFGSSYKRQKQRDTGCCDCYCPNATTLYGGLRTCNGQHILLLGCLLSLLHQYCFHRFHHLRGRSFNALPS